jgi:hypothetical protein
MMRRAIQLFVFVALLVLVLAPAAMATQPTQVFHADGRDGGASAPGPHCHFNLNASENNNSPHGMILTGATHQGHVQTGLPTGVFQATACT